ncbi:MAG: nucleotidyltransferase domain-containing protein [Spirochaetales bacterium]
MGLFFPQHLEAQQVSDIVQSKLAWILAASQPLAVVLFGSAARGAMTDRSDVDFALIFSDEEELLRSRAAIFRRPPPDDRSQDLVFLTASAFAQKATTGGLCQLIRAEGTVLHGVMP